MAAAGHWLLKLQELRNRGQQDHHNTNLVRTPDIEMNEDEDDQWYDTASSEGNSPAKKNPMTDGSNSLVSVKSITPEEEAKLKPYVPALFGKDLPPCGPVVQVAYENVNNRLRKLWLFHRGSLSATDVCVAVKEELNNQNFLYPPFSLKGHFKKRKPWRRETVFQYEMRWIEYFVQEAKAQVPELMTESEIMERKKETLIPQALGLSTDNTAVLGLWTEWHVKKRTKTPALPDKEVDAGLDETKLKQIDQKADTDVKDSSTESVDSELTEV